MSVTAVVGANWGDEGKGKITDVLAKNMHVVARFQGGANAGHTIKNEHGKFALHTLPSGVFYDNVENIIGSGVALDIEKFHNEIQTLKEKGVNIPKIRVSNRAQVIMPYHILLDQYEEERLGNKAYGSTKSGIAPFYSDKYAKIGIQVSELFNDETLSERLDKILPIKNTLITGLYHKEPLNKEDLMEILHKYRDMIAPYVSDVMSQVNKHIKNEHNILLEGQLGTLKDIDYGIYPMVTSSSTLASYGATSLGIPPYSIDKVVTVVKAYSSSVGAGDFVTELHGEEAEQLRQHGGDGGEYGATTGRPRRVGWFDCVASKYGCKVQGTTDVAFTVVDALGYLDTIKVCTAYKLPSGETDVFPVTTELAKATPVYKEFKGWKCDIRGIKKYEELPKECKDYIEFIEKQLGYTITMISNGPSREDIIYR